MDRKSERGDATSALTASKGGKTTGSDRLFLMIYDHLRGLAAHYLRGERPDHTLRPTALVHEAYLRMIDVERIDWQGRTHFFAVAAKQMRRVLVESARASNSAKRGGGRVQVTLQEDNAICHALTIDILSVNQALDQLAEVSPRQAEVAELRIFAGMSVQEVSVLLSVSERTVKRDWCVAQAWLARALGSSSTTEASE